MLSAGGDLTEHRFLMAASEAALRGGPPPSLSPGTIGDLNGYAESIGRWGLAEIERLFALWHRFRAGDGDRPELKRRLIPL